MPVYRVTLRYSEPDPLTDQHLVGQTATLRDIDADSPEDAGWLAKIRLRLAYRPVEIRVMSWVAVSE